MRRALPWLPLGGFALLFAIVASGLIRPAGHDIRSAMVGRMLPIFSLPPIVGERPGLGRATFHQGHPRLLNVFASWCVPCAAETPQLLRLKEAGVAIDGVAVRDTATDIAHFLAEHGDPYRAIGDDRFSALQLALGSSGVPETFVIDGRGRIVEQHIGDLRAEDVPTILQAMARAR